MTLQELLAERSKVNDRQADILTLMEQEAKERPGEVTDEQLSAEYESNEDKIKTCDEQIKPLQQHEQRRATVTQRQESYQGSIGLPVPMTPQVGGWHTEPAAPSYAADLQRQYQGRLSHFKGVIGGMEPTERAYKLGMWGLAALSQQMPNRYSFKKAERFAQEQGLIVHGEGSSDTTGAHVTVPSELAADIINLKESRGAVRQTFQRVPMSTETRSEPKRSGGLTAYAVGENDAGTESDAALEDVMLVARDWMVLTRMSKQLDEDSAVNFGDFLAGEIAYAHADKEDEAGLNGDGTSTYHGILGARTRLQDVDGAGTDSAGLVTQATGTTWGAIVLADFEEVVGTLPQYAAMNPVWIASRTFYWTVMKRVELASGGVTAAEIGTGGAGMFLGIPVVISQVMPTATAVTTVSCLLGDFGIGAMFGDRRTDSVEFSDTASVGGQSVWERNQIAVKGWSRWDIAVHDFGDSTNAGAIVGLETGT